MPLAGDESADHSIAAELWMYEYWMVIMITCRLMYLYIISVESKSRDHLFLDLFRAEAGFLGIFILLIQKKVNVKKEVHVEGLSRNGEITALYFVLRNQIVTKNVLYIRVLIVVFYVYPSAQ